MTRRRQIKFVHEGEYVAEVEVELLESVEDAQKLDEVREALRRGDLATASKLARVFRLTPVIG